MCFACKYKPKKASPQIKRGYLGVYHFPNRLIIRLLT
jgi:hypothetical protein